MQCMHCGTELHPQARVCWKCGKVPAEGIEPPYEDVLTPSEVILLSALPHIDPHSGLMLEDILDEELVTKLLTTALLACEHAGLLRIDTKDTLLGFDLLVTATGKSSIWPFQTLETHIVEAVSPRSRKLKPLVMELLAESRRLQTLGLERLLERGLAHEVTVEEPLRVFGIEMPRRMFGKEMSLKRTLYSLSKAGRELTRKHRPEVVKQMLDAAGEIRWEIEHDVKSALVEMRAASGD